jgi:Tol biopolymer transport system component
VGEIVIASSRSGKFQLYASERANLAQLAKITTDTASATDPAFAPDGSRIAYVSTSGGNAEIYVMNADGSSPLRLTNNAADDFASAWSPDGQKIVFMSFRDGNYEIYVMNADGSSPVRLTNNAALDQNPRWSP